MDGGDKRMSKSKEQRTVKEQQQRKELETQLLFMMKDLETIGKAIEETIAERLFQLRNSLETIIKAYDIEAPDQQQPEATVIKESDLKDHSIAGDHNDVKGAYSIKDIHRLSIDPKVDFRERKINLLGRFDKCFPKKKPSQPQKITLGKYSKNRPDDWLRLNNWHRSEDHDFCAKATELQGKMILFYQCKIQKVDSDYQGFDGDICVQDFEEFCVVDYD